MMSRRALRVAFIISLFCSNAFAAPGDVSKKTPLPFNHPTGAAWDGRYLWVADRSTDNIYRIDLENGSATDSIASPGYFPSGLAWDGELLWSTDPADRMVYATDVRTGRTVRSLESPTPSPMGIAWDGTFLWISDNSSDQISKIDPGDGTTIVSFPAPATDPRGITFGGGYLWCADRLRDEIYMIHPESGDVVITLDAPGPFSWGLTWRDGRLLNTDYQDDAVFEIVVKDGETHRTSDPRYAVIVFTTEADVLGSGTVESLDIFYAVPSDRPNQKILNDVLFIPDPARFTADRWDQKIAVFHYEDLEPAGSAEVTMRVELETSAIRYFIYPEDVGDEIPSEIRDRYLADDMKYDISHPYIQELVGSVVGDEPNLYWRARKLFQHLIANMEYEMVGGWNTAPTVLQRGNGSCSEYSFSYIALCRAAGVPARYVGSLVVRGDDASYDDVFHRWNEIYLPGYGWVPVDANAGDRSLPAEQAAAFGGISNRFLVTTEGGGNSEYLGWSYNHENRWIAKGKCRIRFESTAEWEPLDKESER